MTNQTLLQVEASPSRIALPKGSASVHLDALRGLAAVGVLLSHWRYAFFADDPPIRHHNAFAAGAFALGEMGLQWVIVFFVMSGYLVGGSVLRAVESGRWNWRDYLLRRLTRLYIVLFPALLLGGALDWAGMHIPGAEALYNGRVVMYSLNFSVRSRFTLPALAANALFLQGIKLPGSSGKLPNFGSNGPLWSLSYEFWYYLAFPLLTFLFVKSSSRFTRLACAVGLVVWTWFVGTEIVILGVPWLMGVGIHFLPAIRVRRPSARHLAMAAGAMLLGGALVLESLHPSIIGVMLLGEVVALFIWVTLHCSTGPLPSGYAKLAGRSARSSYTLYLVHLPLLLFLKAALHMPRAVPDRHSFLVAFGLLAVTLVYAQLVYELFEKNTDAVRRWIAPFVTGEAGARRMAAD